MLDRKSELIFATHAAANAAMIEASNNDEFELIAKKHIHTYIRNPKLSAKRKMVAGRISLHAKQHIELPFSKMFGIGDLEIVASSCLPTEFIGINKVENTRSYSEIEILELERQFRRLINAAPVEKRSMYRKEYTKHLQKIKSLNAPKRKARGYKSPILTVKIEDKK